MLEYAANAVVHWSADELRATFETRERENGRDPAELLSQVIGTDEPEHFWEQLRTNLAASRLRLIFVADEIPAELRRLVEFLNEQMQSAEVLAVEVKQYVDSEGQHQTLVPRLVGQTEKARQAKGRVPGKRWNRERLLAVLEDRNGAAAAAVARRIFDWSDKRGHDEWFGLGQHDGSFVPLLRENHDRYAFTLWSSGQIQVKFEVLAHRPPFEKVEMRQALQEKLNAIPGVSIAHDRLTKNPSVPLAALTSAADLQSFLDAMDWVFEEFRTALPVP
jgi:hypothetical protein